VMNVMNDLQMQVNVLFFVVFFLTILTVVTFILAFRTARQWRRTTEQLTTKVALLEGELATTKGN
jgi:hypothetical protein